MSEGTLLLVLAYIALTALLVAALIKTQLPLLVRAGLTVSALALYWASYAGWQSIQGWPADIKPLPERFLLHASVIEEPDPTEGTEGEILIWLSDLTDGKPADQPRAYRLAYDKPLHAELEDALRKLRNGHFQLGRVTRITDRPDRPTDLKLLGQRREIIEFHDVPDPELPEK